MENNSQDAKLDISISEAVASGTYSNLQIVQHSPTEFIVDFIQIMPHVPKAQVKSRIILHPVHAKKLLHALQDNIARYEMTFGKIKEDTSSAVPYAEINPMGKA
ncbi:MAG: DUF3467 domain-containing protein [Bacteroidales bacterium]|nr:DUF3467 domain-containing protein [Bacteroidales bacterium]